MASPQKYFLLFLTECSGKQLREVIKLATKPQLKAIREVIINILRNVINVTAEQKIRLKRYKKILIRFAEKGFTKKEAYKKLKLLKYIIDIAREVIDKL